MEFSRTKAAAATDKRSRWDLVAAIAEDAIDAGVPITSTASVSAAKDALDAVGLEMAPDTVRNLSCLAKFDHESTDRQRQEWRRYGTSIVQIVADAGLSQEAALICWRHPSASQSRGSLAGEAAVMLTLLSLSRRRQRRAPQAAPRDQRLVHQHGAGRRPGRGRRRTRRLQRSRPRDLPGAHRATHRRSSCGPYWKPRGPVSKADGRGVIRPLSPRFGTHQAAVKAIEFLIQQESFYPGTKRQFAFAMNWYQPDGKSADVRRVQDVCKHARPGEPAGLDAGRVGRHGHRLCPHQGRHDAYRPFRRVRTSTSTTTSTCWPVT